MNHKKTSQRTPQSIPDVNEFIFIGKHPCQSVISIKLQSKATLLKSHFGMGVVL